jgi:hypothetical protein
MLEEAYLNEDDTSNAVKGDQKCLETIYPKLGELLDGETGVLAKRDRDLFELVKKGNALVRDLIG